MKWSLFALCIGFCIDLLIGDPHGLPHPVAAIGHLISLLERLFRRRNLALFIVLTGVCIGLLGLMSDFGTAAIFFVTFLAASGPPEPVSGS